MPPSDKNNLCNVHVAMLGARMHYAVPRLLNDAGHLSRFYTDLYIGNKPFLHKMLRSIPFQIKLIEKVLGRKEETIPRHKVKSFDLLGIWYWWLARRARVSEIPRVHSEVGRRFNNTVIGCGLKDADIVYGYNTASLELFHFAKSKGVSCILEQTMAPFKFENELIRIEMERWPGWQNCSRVERDFQRLIEREESEWHLADLIITGSQFVVKGLKNYNIEEN